MGNSPKVAPPPERDLDEEWGNKVVVWVEACWVEYQCLSPRWHTDRDEAHAYTKYAPRPMTMRGHDGLYIRGEPSRFQAARIPAPRDGDVLGRLRGAWSEGVRIRI